MALGMPLNMALTRHVTSNPGRPIDSIDSKHELEVARQKLKASPETVSTGSSVHPVFGEVGAVEEEKDTDMMAGIKSDLVGEMPDACLQSTETCAENHQGDFLASRRASRSILHGHGWCPSLHGDIAVHRLLRVGDQPCTYHWNRLLDVGQDCGNGTPRY